MQSCLIRKDAVLSSVQGKSTWWAWFAPGYIGCLFVAFWDKTWLCIHPHPFSFPWKGNAQHQPEGKKEIITTPVHVNIPRGKGRRKENRSSDYPLIIIVGIIFTFIFISSWEVGLFSQPAVRGLRGCWMTNMIEMQTLATFLLPSRSEVSYSKRA